MSFKTLSDAKNNITDEMIKAHQDSIYLKKGTTDQFMVGYAPVASMEYNQYSGYLCVHLPTPATDNNRSYC